MSHDPISQSFERLYPSRPTHPLRAALRDPIGQGFIVLLAIVVLFL